MLKKFYFVVSALTVCFAFDANAQMTETMGALAIDGMLSGEAAQGVRQMQNAMNKVQFQQDLAELNLKIQTTFMNSYSGLSKEYLDFGGFNGINWQVAAVSPHEYYVEFRGLDDAMCEYLRFNNEAKRAELNGGKGCNGNNNNVKLFY